MRHYSIVGQFKWNEKLLSCPLKDFVFTTELVSSHANELIVGFVILTKFEEDETPNFAIIRKIVLVDDSVLLGCQQLSSLGFDKQFHIMLTRVFYFPANFKSFKASYIFQGVGNKKFVNWA